MHGQQNTKNSYNHFNVLSVFNTLHALTYRYHCGNVPLTVTFYNNIKNNK